MRAEKGFIQKEGQHRLYRRIFLLLIDHRRRYLGDGIEFGNELDGHRVMLTLVMMLTFGNRLLVFRHSFIVLSFEVHQDEERPTVR